MYLNGSGTSYLFLDDHLPSLKNVTSGFISNAVYPDSNDNLTILSQKKEQVNFETFKNRPNIHTVIQEITKYLHGCDLVFINLNLKLSESSRREDLLGVELLKWLRLAGCDLHCILYSFENLHTLLQRKSDNHIIFSEGTTFVRQPNDFAAIKKSIPVLVDKKANQWKTRQAFLKSLNVFEHRHYQANFWGIKQLWKTYEAAHTQEAIHINPVEHLGINKNERFSNSLNNQIGEFVFNKPSIPFEAILQEEKIILRPGDFAYERTEKKKQEFKIKDYLDGLRSNIKKRKLKIFHIDDQAEIGWSKMFCQIIHGDVFREERTARLLKMNDGYFTISLETNENSHNNILKNIKKEQPDLILLDLRLDKEDQWVHSLNIEEMGGAKLLKKIRYQFPGTPVLITTSSNKIWTFRELRRLGADAYWIKEGMDERRSTKDTVENYLRLLQLINGFCDTRYSDLKVWAQEILKINSSSIKTLWWSNFNWIKRLNYADTSDGLLKATNQKKEVVGILLDTLWLLRQELSNAILKIGYAPFEKKKWFIPSLAIQHLGKIIECIHNTTKKTRYFSKLVENIRQDELGLKLLQDRHRASHYTSSSHLTWRKHLREFWEKLFFYLKNPPDPYIAKKIRFERVIANDKNDKHYQIKLHTDANGVIDIKKLCSEDINKLDRSLFSEGSYYVSIEAELKSFSPEYYECFNISFGKGK